MTSIRLFPILIAGTLSACMGGGNDDNPVDTGTGMSFAELEALQTDLIDQVVAAGVTPSDMVPDTGDATYNGTMLLLLMDGSDDGVLGDAEVTVDFMSNAVGGGAENFYDLEGNATAGSVAIENAVIVDVLGSFIAGEVNGTVTFAAGALAVSTGLAGNFSGANVEYVSGVMSETATPAGGAAIAVQGAVYAGQ